MNNKPVAWMDDLSFFTKKPEDMEGVIPLYTYPAELTDEEILEIAGENHGEYGNQLVHFARAILRKAQENVKSTH